MPHPSIAILAAALVLACVCAVIDWRHGVIPNRLTLPLLAVAPLVHAYLARGLRPPVGGSGAVFAALFSLLSAGVCALVPLLLFWLRLAGGGDVKLFAALGALLLAGTGLGAQFFAFATAAFYVPARLAYEGRLFRTLWGTVAAGASLAGPAERRRTLPPDMSDPIRFGPFIVLGTLAALVLFWVAR
jgi:prepilin peptidase CpaA